MAGTPIEVRALSRFSEKAAQDDTLRGLKSGKIDIVIGTHRLLSKDVHFKSLGLLVVDEEQRFGVTHKERIKQLKLIDVLTLSATPIPRTPQMASGGGTCVIMTPPDDSGPSAVTATTVVFRKPRRELGVAASLRLQPHRGAARAGRAPARSRPSGARRGGPRAAERGGARARDARLRRGPLRRAVRDGDHRAASTSHAPTRSSSIAPTCSVSQLTFTRPRGCPRAGLRYLVAPQNG
jgi:hypothetical protein